jgi:hypothetical protein
MKHCDWNDILASAWDLKRRVTPVLIAPVFGHDGRVESAARPA